MRTFINLDALILTAGSLALACGSGVSGGTAGSTTTATTTGGALTGADSGSGNATTSGAGPMSQTATGGTPTGTGVGGTTGSGTAGVTGVGGTGQGGTDTSAGGMGGTIASGGTGGAGTTGAISDDGPEPSEGCGKEPTITTGNGKSITVSNVEEPNRSYNIRLPDNYDKDKPHRLIIGYHGATLSANLVTNESFYGLAPLSEGSAIFVAPQGLDTGGQFSPGWPNDGGEDVEFSRQLIAELESALCIDKSRIFAQGFSMGGSMAYAMACGAPDLIRAVAVHSGGPMSGCAEHDTPVAYFMTHGTQDDLCTYPEYGVPEMQDFAGVNGCTNPNPTSSASEFESGLPNPTDSNSACIDVEGCMEGYPVRSCLFVGPHIWNPGGGNTWVSAEAWNFFSQF